MSAGSLHQLDMTPPLSAAAWARQVELVFLVGSPRSGTTWLQAMLAGHPDVYTGPETHFFALFDNSLFKSFVEMTHPKRHGMARYWRDEQFAAWIAMMFRHTISSLPAPSHQPRFFLEKTPTNCLRAAIIARVFPQARFIHLIRDGRAVVASLMRLHEDRPAGWGPKGTAKAARTWRDCVTAGQAIPSLVADPACQYTEVRYEALRRDTPAEMARLFQWLGLVCDTNLTTKIAADHQLDVVRKSKERFATITTVAGQEKIFHDRFFGAGAINPDEMGLGVFQRHLVEWTVRRQLRELGYMR